MERSDTKRLQESLEAEAAILRGALRNRESIVIESASEEYERMRLAGGDSLGKPMRAPSGNGRLRTRTEGLFLPLPTFSIRILDQGEKP